MATEGADIVAQPPSAVQDKVGFSSGPSRGRLGYMNNPS